MVPPLFYQACLPVRIVLGIGLIFAARTWPKPTATLVIASVIVGFVLMYLNATYRKPNVWWSRHIHILFMIMIASTGVMVLFDVTNVLPTYLGVLVLLDALFGFISSLMV
jgi:hypothetical protein